MMHARSGVCFALSCFFAATLILHKRINAFDLLLASRSRLHFQSSSSVRPSYGELVGTNSLAASDSAIAGRRTRQRSIHHGISSMKMNLDGADEGNHQHHHSIRSAQNKFVSDSMRNRLRSGRITSYELDRLYGPTKYDVAEIKRPLSTGFVGFIFSLEGALVNADKAIVYSYMLLAGELKEAVPDTKLVRDLIGTPFREAVIALGWESRIQAKIDKSFSAKYNAAQRALILKTEMADLEFHFYEVFMAVIDKMPVLPAEGALALVNQALEDENEATVVTSFPRQVAIKLLARSGVSTLFEKYRVNPEHLVCDEAGTRLVEWHNKNTADAAAASAAAEYYQQGGSSEGYPIPLNSAAMGSNDIGGRMRERDGAESEVVLREGQQFLECCVLMQKPTVLTLLIDANRRNMLMAKRKGVTVAALRGKALHAQYLRSADFIVGSLTELPVREAYKLVRKALMQAEGPDQATAAAGVREPTVTRLISAPAQDNKRPAQDTFADEFGSDMA